MNIIDKAAESSLIQALKSLDGLEGCYCMRINSANGNTKHNQQLIISQTQEHLPSANLYVCKDGEIFLLAHVDSANQCKKVMLAIANILKVQPTEHIGEVYNLALQTDTLLMLLENKVEQYHEIDEETVKEQEKVAVARKRQEILNQDSHKTAEQIATQRKLRNKPIFMIIEDDPFSRRLVENALQKQYQLTSLSSGEMVLSAYADLAPDLLFLDINLPDVTGHELLEKIVALDPKAYVVMLSGNADRANVMQAVQHGAAGFIAKPFSREKLFQYIERCPTIGKKKVI
jgi:CheY-like chemotaxis protein